MGIICLPAIILAVAIATTIPIGLTGNALADTPGPNIISINAKTHGLSYGDLFARWFKWVYAVPKEKSPVGDTTGQFCGQGQNGPVWFLGGTFGGSAVRSCTIPSGVVIANCPIFFEASPAEYPDAKNNQDLLDKAKNFMNKVTDIEFSVDGVKLQNVSKYIIQSPVFDFSLPKNNVLGIPAQSTHGVAYGIFVVIPPLSPGNHVIHSRGASVDFTEGSPQNFVSDVTYHLNVKPK